MSRAELRRMEKETKKAKTATYNFTEEQLDLLIREGIKDKLDEVKKEAFDQAVSTATLLMLGLPMEVLKDYYWQKSYKKALPGFMDLVLDYYEMWQNGELDDEQLRTDLLTYSKIRVENEGK